MTATAHICIPDVSTPPSHVLRPDKLPSEKYALALDSHSDVAIADSRFVYHKKTIDEEVSTGGGTASFKEEGLVDIITSDGSIAVIPALVATQPRQLPTECAILLGQAQLNQLGVSVNDHMRVRGLPLICHVALAEDDFALDPVLSHTSPSRPSALACYWEKRT